ncbi:hypothetical protein CONCODRAFT_78352 [Conidiobolus coronatus NRRL 28638]|jgi:hypothetical protein|uniref:Uncharacterized protein n=1 Tax=Conidiobolus coronatus (strain ATCC 28846 / CBS 209.66 / NRRL 28638) TaxID=796925 RepID=A0A137P8X5_CONC2|nr:hypothetical protein CONCODRAFT_78352 [Conidiobolus coronatus NRRL 28638]|eukprot:KXN71450.1 hypothetical protein CONCODRAFT_78352 [Conidiobolus coronatus NRRL 28638]
MIVNSPNSNKTNLLFSNSLFNTLNLKTHLSQFSKKKSSLVQFKELDIDESSSNLLGMKSKTKDYLKLIKFRDLNLFLKNQNIELNDELYELRQEAQYLRNLIQIKENELESLISYYY